MKSYDYDGVVSETLQGDLSFVKTDL